ncbi:phage tail tape measure protein [Kitasatospora sp. NPDC088264]|uniref:phage tail tape measure protein n=1 Tax=Kitasatospora sp. NPDC088264 TaxID=3155296 RepID=UPI00342B59B9
MGGAYNLYVALQASLGGLITGLRGGAQQLRAFDGQLSGTRAALERVEAAAQALGRAQAAAAAEATRAQAVVRESVERSAAAQNAAAVAAERAGRAQAVAAQSAARAQAEHTAAVEATARAARAQEIAQTMAARAQATNGAGAAAAQNTAAAATAAATRALEAQTVQAARAATAQEAAGRAALVAQRFSAAAAEAETAAAAAVAGRAAAEEAAARRTAASLAAVGRAEAEVAAAGTAAASARADRLAKGALLLTAILTVGSGAAIDLEKHMANVMTISQQIDSSNVSAFTDEIVKLSTRLPQTASQLAEGLYQVISTGYDGAQAMSILEVAATGASAGMTTTEVSARALLGVMKAYGLPVSAASDVMDVMFKTVDLGVISFEELAQQLGDVVPMAAAAGVRFDDLSAALAAITLAGIPAAESATALNMLMTRMMKPTQELRDAVRGLGYESTASAVAQDGLYVVLNRLNGVTKGNAEAITVMFKDIRAVRAMLALAAADGANYASTYSAIANEVERAGATQRAYAIQTQTVSGQWTLFRNEATALGMDLSQALLPTLQALGSILHTVLGSVNDLPGPVKDAAEILIGLSAAGLLVRAAFVKAAPAVTAFRTALAEAQAGGAVFPAVLRGAGLAVGGLTALLTVGIGVYAAYTAGKQRAKDATEELVSALKAERSEGEKGSGIRKLAEQLTSGDDAAKLRRGGLDLAEAVDAVASGGAKLEALKKQLEQSESSLSKDILDRKVAGNEAGKYDAAKKILTEKRKVWEEAVQKEADLAETMNIVNSKISRAVQGNAKAWSLEDLAPLDKKGVPAYTDQMKALAKAVGDVVQPTEAWKTAQERAGSAAKLSSQQIDLTKASVGEYTTALSKQVKASQEFQGDLDELARRGYGPLADHLRSLGDASAGMTHTLVENLRAGKQGAADQLSGLVQVTKTKLDDYMAELRRQLEAQRSFQANLSELALAGYGDLTSHFAELGVSAAPMLDELVKQLKDGKTKVADELQSILTEDAARSQATFQSGLEQLPAIAARYGQDVARAWAKASETNDVAAFGKVLQTMAVQDMTKAVKDATAASGEQMAIGLDLVTKIAQAKGTDAAGAFANALLAGDIDRAMNSLKATWGANQPISPPDLTAVVGAFKTAGQQANGEWTGMLDLIAQVSKTKGTAAAQALTQALMSGDMTKVQATLDSIGASVRAIPGSKSINVNVNAPQSVNIPVKFSYDGYNSDGTPHIPGMGRWANGGIVDFYANGALRPPSGERHIAHIAPAGSWRVFGEPETGGEAYLPLSPAKRERSKLILNEVAGRFGATVLYGAGRLNPVGYGRDTAWTGSSSGPAAVKLVPARSATTNVVVRDNVPAPLVGSISVTVTGSNNLSGEQVAEAVMRKVRHIQRGGRV